MARREAVSRTRSVSPDSSNPSDQPEPSSWGLRRSTETRARILQAGVELFAERGVANVTVGQIAERAEIGKGTFFNYFRSKEAILNAFEESQVQRLEQALVSGSVQGTPRERVLQALILLAEHPHLTTELARGLFVTCLTDVRHEEREASSIWRCRDLLAAIVREGQEQGSFRNDLPADEAALFALGQYFLALLSWCAGYTEQTLVEAVRHNVSLALDALTMIPCAG